MIKNSLALEALQSLLCPSYTNVETSKSRAALIDEVAADQFNVCSKQQFVGVVSGTYTINKDELVTLAQKYNSAIAYGSVRNINIQTLAEMLYGSLSEAQRVAYVKEISLCLVSSDGNLHWVLYSAKYAVSVVESLTHSTKAVEKFLALEALGRNAWSQATHAHVRDAFVRWQALGELDRTVSAEICAILARVCAKYDTNVAAPVTDVEMAASLRQHYLANDPDISVLRRAIASVATNDVQQLQLVLNAPTAAVYKRIGFSSKTEGVQWIVTEVLRTTAPPHQVQDLQRIVALGLERSFHQTWFSLLEQEKKAHGFVALLRLVPPRAPPAPNATSSDTDDDTPIEFVDGETKTVEITLESLRLKNPRSVVFLNNIPAVCGGFGDVMRATLTYANGTGVDVAVKKLTPRHGTTYENVCTNARKEIAALIAAHDVDGVGQLLRWWESPKDATFYLATVFYFGGNLHELLHVADQRPVLEAGESLMRRFAVQLARALYLLHTRDATPLCHFDLKPSNVMLTAQNFLTADVVIVDFGCARSAVGTGTIMPYCTLEYAAPEVRKMFKANSASDLYSFGVMLWEMFQTWPEPLAKVRPPPSAHSEEAFENGQFPNDLTRVPNEQMRAIIEKCCKWRPADRLSAKQVFDAISALGGAHEQMEANVSALTSFVRRRIAESETLYVVNNKRAPLRDWGRIKEVRDKVDSDLRRFFTEKQLQMLADGVNTNLFIAHPSFDQLNAFQGVALDENMTHGVYLWRSAVTKRGYVGKLERNKGNCRRDRDHEHRTRNSSPFDRNLATHEQREKWMCVSVCATEPLPADITQKGNQQEDNVRLECLLALLLNTYMHRDGWNFELGGVWGATKSIHRQRAGADS